MDFDKYKPRFLDYLRLKSIDNRPGLIRCFSPDHEDKNPSCQISEDGFFCHACGIHGDIYDAIGILEGITDKAEQYLFAEKIFDGGPSGVTPRPAPQKPVREKRAKDYSRDTAADGLLEAYMRRNPAAEKIIKEFLKVRAAASTAGAARDYPDDIIPELMRYFFYWPGYDIASREINTDILDRCKISQKAWEHSGVVLKIGTGYKLHYYYDSFNSVLNRVSSGVPIKAEKRNTQKGYTFPMPGKIDEASPVILVEAEMNAVSCAAIGIKNVFAVGGCFGITKTDVKAYLLNVPEIIIFYDSDEAGRSASGIIPLDPNDDRKTNIPGIIRQAGYKGKIKIAELPPVPEDNKTEKDQDALIVLGKREIVLKALEEAREYIPPEPSPKSKEGASWEAFDTISISRLKSVLSKIPKNNMDQADIEPFVSACIKACKHSDVTQELAKWGATIEELNAQNNTSPYFIVEACEKYGVSKYIKNEIENALIPASEILKKIKVQKTIIDIDFEKMKKNENAMQFITTKGVHSAALMIADILDDRMIYVESEKHHYFFNGHTWQREPDMPDIIYNLLCAVLYNFILNKVGKKNVLTEIVKRIESRRFRVEVSQDFSGLPHIFNESILFDGPTVKETLTLADGVIDFSGSEIIYRKSRREEFRREMLPYKINDIKNAGPPEKFLEFMKGNFTDEKTLETLLYSISLIPSRNTQYKYGFIWVGKTHTGKTTTLELLSLVYKGMFVRINPDILVTRERRRASGNEATPYIARLEGKGLGMAQETERNGVLNNALWKELTGGDTLTARGLYQMPHDFEPTAQILVCTNHQPRFDAHDTATVDRMVVIPFSIQHERGKKGTIHQTTIYSRLRPEYPAIIKFFAEYYIRFKNEFEGTIPLSIECSNYKQNYVKHMETDLDKFVNDNLEIDMSGNVFEKVQDVYDRYLQYYNFKADDKEALTRNKFVRYIRNDWMEINYKQKKINGEPILCFFNVRLKPYSGKTEEPAPKDDDKSVTDNGYDSGKYADAPPEDEMPF